MCADPCVWTRYKSLHTGDNVVACIGNLAIINILLKNLQHNGCKINAQKQSVGNITAKFLRMAKSRKNV